MVEKSRGGPQLIPRPSDWQPGPPPAWAPAIGASRTASIKEIEGLLAPGLTPVLDHPDGPRVESLAAGPVPAHVSSGHSAVAVLFAPDPTAAAEETEVLLTRRSWNMRSHRGEVSFPGGTYEVGDRSAADTALRETHEEVGVAPAFVTVVGQLGERSTFISSRRIFPVVGLLQSRPSVQAEAAEVDAILHVGLTSLLHPDCYHSEIWQFGGQRRVMHFFDHEQDTIWGLTAVILAEVLGHVFRPSVAEAH